MGMTTSACWAQALPECIGEGALLSEESRLVADRPPPEAFPVWGSIEDDFWVIEELDDDSAKPIGPGWMKRVIEAWRQVGVESHPKKEINAAFGIEVQGAWIDEDGWCGLSRAKRWRLLEAGLRLLAMPRVRLQLFERFIGKLGFAQYFKSCCRSVLEKSYAWIQNLRRRGARVARLWPQVRAEVFASLILLPFCQIDLRSRFHPPGGVQRRGARRAWASLDHHG